MRVHALAARLLLAVEVAAALGLLFTAGQVAALAGHLLWGVPATLERLPRLQGPPALVIAGLGLQAFVCVTVLTAARGRRKRVAGRAGEKRAGG